MAYFSVLDLEQPDITNPSRPGFFWDLNLNQIMELVQRQSPQYDVLKLYYCFPADEVCARYRREIYGDIKQPEVYECFRVFSERMRKAAAAKECFGAVRTELQKGAWYVIAADEYCAAVSGLQAALSGMSLYSEGLKKLSEYLDGCIEQESFRKCREEAGAIRRMQSELHLILEIEDNRIVVNRGKGRGAYERKLGYEEGARRPAPFLGGPEMSPLEEAVFGAFRRKEPELFDRVERFAEGCPDHEDPAILRLEQEIQYYLAFFRFEEQMKEQGFSFCTPDTDRDRNMGASGLYDLALACANHARGRAVVSNDFAYEEGERFFVVGGPNQGGKTTFARSLGQLVYFGKMGLDVPAVWANVPYFTALLTHFSAEESLGSGKGKLKEELMRLAPMMKEQAEGAFVIINELFTTAAHYDGCVMGKRVLSHFIEKGCMGIYVTHLKELGDSMEGVAALTAMLDGSRERKRTYKISRQKLEDVGYAEDIVKKYGLTYQKLHKRLAGEREERQ
ncbi:MAG: hypothetical protein NC517_12350 [Firmicutes bacterium]|nr:hypothetical protein [Bacillota bacterium]